MKIKETIDKFQTSFRGNISEPLNEVLNFLKKTWKWLTSLELLLIIIGLAASVLLLNILLSALIPILMLVGLLGLYHILKKGGKI